MERTIFPRANNYRFIKHNQTLSPRHNFFSFDDAPETQTKPNELLVPFRQKVQYTDQQQLVFHSEPGSIVTASIYSYDRFTGMGTQVEVLAPVLTLSYIHNYRGTDGQTHALETYYYRWLYDTDHTEGEYFLFIHVEYPDETTEDFIGNVINLRTKHRKTALIRYTHTKTEFDVQWALLSVRFTLRVDTDWMKTETGSDRVVFTEQDSSTGTLFNNPMLYFNFQIGGGRGVPEWMLDKINRAFCCDTFSIEGKRYKISSDSKFEDVDWKNYPLKLSSIKLEIYRNTHSAEFFRNDVSILTRTGNYPYAHTSWGIVDLNTGKWIFMPTAIHEDEDADDDYVTDTLNDEKVEQFELLGEWEWVADVLTYHNGPGENFIKVYDSVVVTDIHLDLTVNAPSGGNVFTYTMSGTGIHIVDWGEGAPEQYAEPGFTGLGAPILQTIGHIYFGTGDKTLRIFTDDKMTVLKFAAQANKITAIDEDTNVSVKLRNFWAQGQNINGVLDLTFLKRSKDELREMNFNNSSINGIAAGWASPLVSGSYKPFKLCRYYYFENNNIDDTSVDNLFIEVHGHTNYTFGGGWGQIRINGQSPSAPPTVASAAARTALGSASTFVAPFWHLVHD